MKYNALEYKHYFRIKIADSCGRKKTGLTEKMVS